MPSLFFCIKKNWPCKLLISKWNIYTQTSHDTVGFQPRADSHDTCKSSEFIVKSRCSSDVDSARNSAKAMALAEAMEVDDRKRRLGAVFKLSHNLSVNAVRSDWHLWLLFSTQVQLIAQIKNLTLTRPGREQGFLFKSSVSKLELYF